MRKSILFLLISGAICPVFAQLGYFSVGYNGNIFKSEKLDFVIDRYNETRAYLDKTMDYPHYIDGLDLHFGGGSKVIFDIGYAWRGAEVSASGIDASGINQQRDLKYKFGVWNFALAYNFLNSTDFMLALGYNQTLGSEKIESRVGPAADIENENYTDIIKSFSPAAEFFIQVGVPLTERAGLLIKPYYHLNLVETDYGDVNRAINPATAAADDFELLSAPGGFGISIMAAFGRFGN